MITVNHQQKMGQKKLGLLRVQILIRHFMGRMGQNAVNRTKMGKNSKKA